MSSKISVAIAMLLTTHLEGADLTTDCDLILPHRDLNCRMSYRETKFLGNRTSLSGENHGLLYSLRIYIYEHFDHFIVFRVRKVMSKISIMSVSTKPF